MKFVILPLQRKCIFVKFPGVRCHTLDIYILLFVSQLVLNPLPLYEISYDTP